MVKAVTHQDTMTNGTARGMLLFLEDLVDRGRAQPGSVNPLKSAARQILSTVDGDDWESVDVRGVDVDDYMARFANKTHGTYTSGSLRAYSARLRRALTWYSAFLSRPDWTPPQAGQRTPKRSSASRPQDDAATAAAGSSNAEQSSPAQPDDRAPDLITYPFPLVDGRMVYLRLPVRLSTADARRISAFLDSMAVDGPPPKATS